ncbi:unnamed protein product [Blepharisma stoltei]|uniref:Uncharacterized protein n=1 Tax=Blepharisma stoltei TaxID=1481888 RepID=A0AAU9INX6_9CILI|nr:unnamed protein product [Blepharisma stoltei]
MLNTQGHQSPVKLVPLIRRRTSRKIRYITPTKLTQDISSSRQTVGQSLEDLRRSVSPFSPEKYSTKFAFYEGYKRINTNSYARLENSSPQVSYLKELSRSHKKPETLRLFHDEEENVRSLSINEYGIGDAFATVFSAAIKDLPRLEKLNLKNNRLRDQGAVSIISNINSQNLKYLDLSGNLLGSKSISALAGVLKSNNCSLEVLKLESTKISSESIKVMTEALYYNATLRHLNLAKNNLNEVAGIHLGKLIFYNRSLISLDLHWNYIRGEGAIGIFKGLIDNTNLQGLDLSWNSMGNDKIHKTSIALSEALAQNERLKHFDLSNNYITFEESKDIAKGLSLNHTLIGFHIEGNHCVLDAFGYIHPKNNTFKEKYDHFASRILTRTNFRKINRNCWICEGWTDLKITWNPACIVWNRRLKHFAMDKLSTQTEPVFVHFEIDDFQPHLLTKTEDGTYEALRAVKTGKVRFFFSYRGFAQISSQFKVEALGERLERNFHFYGNYSKTLLVVVVNYIDVEDNGLTVAPRPIFEEYVPPPGDKPEPDIPVWSLETSIFAKYITDTSELLDRCFEFDWANTKIHNIIKNGEMLNHVKEFLRREYKIIYETYKYHASIGNRNNIFLVNSMTLTEIFQKCSVFDKQFKISDMDLHIKAANFTNQAAAQGNPAFGAIRHEFLEIIVRSALDKYMRSGVCGDEITAIKRFMEDIRPYFRNFDANKWRWERYFNEDCDAIIQNNKDLLEAVYEANSGKFSMPGDRRFMVLDEFLALCQKVGHINEKVNARQAIICYHLAMMTQVDEINLKLHMQASFLEFLEAWARLTDIQESDNPEADIFKVYSVEDTPLDEKLENSYVEFAVFKNPRRMRKLLTSIR